MYRIVLGSCLLVLLSFSSANRGVIAYYYPYLVGEYALVKVVSDQQLKESAGLKDSFRVIITKNDRLHLIQKGKRKKIVRFISARSPVEDTENYVLFLDGQDNYPLYFYGDTIMNYYWPEMYSENYFIRCKR
jgi:hypothetical protein